MAKNASQFFVAKNGSISVAPVGSTLPDDLDALDGAFVELGYVTPDGVGVTANPDILEIFSWQSRQATRRDLQAQEFQAEFTLQQFNSDTLPLALGGGEITEPTPGVFRYDLPTEDDSLDERALVIDSNDADRDYRIVIPRGNVVDAVEIVQKRDQEAQLKITFKALEPSEGGSAAYILTDDPNLEPSS